MTDRVKLEEAIKDGRNMCNGMPWASWFQMMETLLAAAQAWADTLPKTKMVEVWRTEFVFWINGRWQPTVNVFLSISDAEQSGKTMTGLGAKCVHVTGPHMQEVPA